MIQLDRSRLQTPKVFRSRGLASIRDKAETFYAVSAQRRRLPRFDWHAANLLMQPVRPLLKRLGNGKCAYCESVIADGTPSALPDIDYFRPRGGALGHLGKIMPDHYWWLAFKWENILPACTTCNAAKSNRFPVGAARAKPGASRTQLLREQPLLLDPCVDAPESHLVYDSNGRINGLTERGRVTIEVLALNRISLVEARKQEASRLRASLDILYQAAPRGQLSPSGKRESARVMREILDCFGQEKPYQGILRQVLQHWLRKNAVRKTLFYELWARNGGPMHRWLARPGNMASPSEKRIQSASSVTDSREAAKEKHSVDGDSISAREAYFSGLRRIERIEIENFKSIEHLTLTIPPPGKRESWLMFVGENATGKSSLLQAIALTLLGEDHIKRLALDARDFVRKNARGDSGRVRIHLTNIREPVELTFNRHSRSFSVNPPAPLVFLLAYGATRLLPRSATTQNVQTRHVRGRNLFNPYARLQNAERWLTDRKEVPESRFQHIIVPALKRLLVLEDDDEILRHRRRVRILRHGHESYLSDMSDGYQSVVALAVDIMMSVMSKWDAIDVAEGVVLVDEIETHLHPRWKMQLVERLRSVFPRMLFFCTTHDPLCLRGLRPGEIVVLRHEEEKLLAEVVNQPVDHLRADQLLTSPLFGLTHTRARSIEDAKLRYVTLAKQKTLGAAQKAEFTALHDLLGSALQSGETPSERRTVIEQKQSFVEDMQVGAVLHPKDISPALVANVSSELKRLQAALTTAS
jgi:uncharacterized protein (TIGR02646 family)